MSRVSPLRIALFCGLLSLFALVSANCKARTYITCGGLCENVLPCNYTYNQCIAFCTDVQTRCENVGRPAVFQAYVACTTDAGFSCDYGDAGDAGDASIFPDVGDGGPFGVPVANAPCLIQQSELVQCESFDGQPPLDIPEGSYEPAFACVDAGSCLACCAAAYPEGAKEYREAVLACVCGDAGIRDRICACPEDGSIKTHPCTPAVACATAVCSSPRSKEPVAGDPCDQCLTAVLNEQSMDAGACVEFVTKTCNTHVDCAGYANCVSQSGCTN
jgi:hypothetical protein